MSYVSNKFKRVVALSEVVKSIRGVDLGVSVELLKLEKVYLSCKIAYFCLLMQVLIQTVLNSSSPLSRLRG